MMLNLRTDPCLLLSAALLLLASSCGTPTAPEKLEERDADVVIVGAGIAGLSAALEIARGGGDVLVVDLSSVFGGHAVSAHGGLSIVGSPVKAAAGVVDTPEIAFSDFTRWGEDADQDWVRYYVEHSKREVHDWLVEQGVEFEELWHPAGNSVPRFHNVRGRGLGLVTPIYLNCLRRGVRFQWNTLVDGLIVERGRVAGVRGKNQRSEARIEFRAPSVMLATGGFQSNLDRVREHWDPESPFPDRILAGSGWNSQGLGLDLARKVNARFHRLDHQWNYVTGLPDPRYPEYDRGLNLRVNQAIWVNVQGVRFVNRCASAKEAMTAVLRQPTGSYWAVFDSRGREGLAVSGSGWSEEKIEKLIFGNRELVRKANSVPELARAAGIPPKALAETVSRFNRMVDQGRDTDFSRFGSSQGLPSDCQKVIRLEQPPFYAIRLFPLTRKSMGGVQIDMDGRVLSAEGGAIPGLYAAGEVAGFGGINGKAGLEGTFLGPSILTGRVGGTTILSELRGMEVIGPQAGAASGRQPVRSVDETGGPASDNSACTRCHDPQALDEQARPGFWHFELSHRVVRERNLPCSQCHSEFFPYDPDQHRVDPIRRAHSCSVCHGLQAID